MSRKRGGNKPFNDPDAVDRKARLIAIIGIIITGIASCFSISLAIKSGERAKVSEQPDIVGYYCISKSLDFKKEFKGQLGIENFSVIDDSYIYQLKKLEQDCPEFDPRTRFLWLIIHNGGRGRTDKFHIVSIDYRFGKDRHVRDFRAKEAEFQYKEVCGTIKKIEVKFKSPRMAFAPLKLFKNESIVLLMESFVPTDSDGQMTRAEKYIEQKEFEGFKILCSFYDVYSLRERKKPNTWWRKFRRFLKLVEGNEATKWPLTVDLRECWP